ncbi:caspase family protein [Flavilitoribacter nigricans]|nr:caspase family protein [Flavilitoribacter nigricans]
MKKLILFLNLIIPALLLAQPGDPDWELTYGGNNDDEFHKVIEATNGYLVAVGETRSKTAGGTDGFLVIADFSTGGKIAEVRLGGSKDDRIMDVVQTFDGHFLLAGYTESSGQGKGDAWLIKTDERGREVWRKDFGSSGEDMFRKLVLLPDGSVLAAGYKNDARSGDIWLVKIDGQQIIWEKELGRGNFEAVKSMALMPDGGVVLVGNAQKSSLGDKGDVYVLRTLPDGSQSWVKFFGDRDWEEVADVIVTRDGGIAFCGLTTSKGAGGMDMWLVKVSNSGFMQWEQTYGGKDDDLANTLDESPEGNLIIGGGTQSHRSGARQYVAFLVRTDAGGIRQSEFPYGDNKEDLANHVHFLHDGSLVMAGRTASKGPGGNSAWLVRWESQQSVYGSAVAGAKQAGLEFSQTKLHTSDGQLKPDDRTYLSFTLTNRTGADLNGLQIRVNRQQTVAGLNFWESNYVAELPNGGAKEVRIPVMAASQLETGESTLGVSIMAGNTQVSQFDTKIKTKKPVDAAVEFADYDFSESRTSDEQSLTVELQNPGDFAATPVSVIFDLPAGLEAVGSRITNIESIPPHGSKKAQLRFKRTSTFRSSSMSIVCTVRMNGKEYRKTLDRALSTGNHVTMILTQPNQNKTDIKNIISEGNIYSIQMGVSAPVPVQQQSFTVYRNNQALDGSKMDEVDLYESDNQSQNGEYIYVYETKVHLEPGENEVQIRVKTGENEFTSKTMLIYYEPRQPNLHVLAIGPSHQDLKFTAKDAADFANAFEGQAGPDKLFGQVIIRKLVTTEETEADRIREAIADLVYQHRNPAAAQRILSNDVLMVFVSSHGKNGQGGFLLLPSNYDPRYERTRTINFQQDVVQELEKINCKKVVMIDACHSGAADSKSLTDVARADALTKLAAMHPGMSTLTSCRSNELSYEDPRWENGAFTEAILEGFANKACMDENGAFQADIDNNSILTLGELYDFLRRRVPNLIKTQKPNATTNQTPFMPENQLDRANMSIFAIGG